jgi:sugar phosphate isomerase/epimerase
VCFDTNHLLKESSEDFARAVGPHIVTLHVSDYDGKDERHWMAGEDHPLAGGGPGAGRCAL